MNNQKLKTSKHYVAYLDILGTKNIIKKDKNDNYLNKLNSIYQNVLLQAKSALSGYNDKEFFIKIFSDNILIAINLDENKNSSKIRLERLINFVGLIQLQTLESGYLLRGAITKGYFYKNDIFVHGNALVDAVTLEENNAIYPRIILQSPAKITQSFATKDSDGYYYVNSYSFSNGWSSNKIKTNILKNLKSNKNNPKVTQKIMWMITYHNNYFKSLESNFCQYKPFITKEEINKALL